MPQPSHPAQGHLPTDLPASQPDEPDEGGDDEDAAYNANLQVRSHCSHTALPLPPSIAALLLCFP